MSNKTKHVLYMGGFLAVFGVLLTLATFFDLKVSHILADGNLAEGRYYSVSFPCNLVEIAGAWPIWAALVFAFTVLHIRFSARGGIGKVAGVLFFLLSVMSAMLLMRDGTKYALRIYGREELLNAAGTVTALWIFGLAAAALVLRLAGGWIRQNQDSLLPFALAILCSCLCYFIIEIIKSPVGRMRFRGLQMIGDYSCYTPWYQVSAAKELLADRGLAGDCFKSFPSGHTFSAGMSYLIIMLPDVFPRLGVGKRKIWYYLIPVCYTGFVGFFRIAAGAHFFSDVLVGGTLAYLSVQVFRYVFLCRNRKKADQAGRTAA